MTSPLDRPAFLAHLRADSVALTASGTTAAGTTVPVPSCPGWDIAELLSHTGSVHLWAAAIVRGNLSERPPFTESLAPAGVDIVEWYREAAAEIADALATADPSGAPWNFAGAPPTVAFWVRRQAQEVSIHRWDGQSAIGTPSPIDALLGADGVDERLPMLARGFRAKTDLSLGGSLHLHATDAEGEWTIRVDGGQSTIESGHGKGDAALRGPAGLLNLAVWGRVPLTEAAGFERFGDTDVIDAFAAAL